MRTFYTVWADRNSDLRRRVRWRFPLAWLVYHVVGLRDRSNGIGKAAGSREPFGPSGSI
jgi:hypothetical protein